MTYSAEVLADSPLAYWRLGETSGSTAVDSSGNGRDATYAGSPTLGATGLLSADADKAMGVVANSGSRASIAAAGWMPSGNLTIECWANLTSGVDGTNGDALVSQYDSGGFRWILGRWTTGVAFIQLQTSGGFCNCFGSSILGSSTHHIAGKWDGSTLKVYVDGALEASVSATGTLVTSTAPLEIGQYSGSAATTPGGTIDEVAIYGSALSDARIAAHYNAGAGALAGSLAATIPAPTASLSGSYGEAGTLAASIPAPTAALAGSYAPPAITGTLGALIAAPTASLAGGLDGAITGSLIASIPGPTAAFAGGAAFVGNLDLADAILYNGATYDGEIHPATGEALAQFAWPAATITLNPTGIAAKPGTYNSNGAGNDSKTIEVIGQAPMIANEYLQVGDASHRGQVDWGSYRNIVSSQTPRLARGTDVLLAFSYKGYYGDGRDNSNIGLRVVAQGPSHPDYADMVAIWDALCDRAEQLATDFPERIVWLGLPEGEVDAKINKYLNALAGDRVAATTAEAGEAWDFLLARGKTRAPHVRFALWFAGTQKALISQVMAGVTTRPHCVIGDPYTNGTAIETLANCFNDWLDWLRADDEYVRLSGLGDGTAVPCGIGEFGMETPAHSDARVKTYLTGMYQTLVDCGLEFAVWFDSDRDKGHVITNGNYPQACAQFNTELTLARSAPIAYQSYTFEIIGRVRPGATTPSLYLYTTTDLDDPDAATWTEIDHVDATGSPAEGDIVTLSLEIGPDSPGWDAAVALAQQVAWETHDLDVLAASWSGAPLPDPGGGVIPDEDDLTGGPVLSRPTPSFDTSFVADMPMRVIVPVTEALV